MTSRSCVQKQAVSSLFSNAYISQLLSENGTHFVFLLALMLVSFVFSVLVALLAGPWRRGTMRALVAERLAPLISSWQVANVKITAFAGAPCGASVSGIDLHDIVLPKTADILRAALGDHGVLLFRRQFPPLREPDVLAVAEIFGDPVPPSGLETTLNLYRVKDRDRDPTGADFWHSDNSYMFEPGGPTLLYALMVPRREDGIPIPEKYYEDGLPKLPDALHPVLRVNPSSGKEVLFVSPAYVRELQDMPEAEAEAILAEVYDHILNEPFLHRHRWQTGDLLVWDNGRMLHKATTLDMPPGVERIMLRVQTRRAD